MVMLNLGKKHHPVSVEDVAEFLKRSDLEEVSTIELSARGLGVDENAAMLLGSVVMRAAHLKTVVLDRNFINDDAARSLALAIQFLSGPLDVLDLSNNRLTAVAAEDIASAFFQVSSKERSARRTPQLLDLSHNQLEDQGVIAVANHLGGRTFVRLRLQGVNCGSLGLENLLKKKECFAELDVGMNPLGANGMTALSKAVRAPRLRWRSLGVRQLTAVPCHGGAESRVSMTSLFGGWQKRLVGPLSECARKAVQLRELDCGGNGLGDRGCAELVQALSESEPHTLERLCLAFSGCGILTANALQHVLRKRLAGYRGGSPGLKVLELQQNNLTNESVAVLAEGIARSATLTVLRLAHNKISCQGAADLAAALDRQRVLRDLPPGCSMPAAVTELDLAMNPIGDEGAEALARAAQASAMHPDNRDALAFKAPWGLERLVLAGTAITADGIRILHDAVRARAVLVILALDQFPQGLDSTARQSLRRRRVRTPSGLEVEGVVQLNDPVIQEMRSAEAQLKQLWPSLDSTLEDGMREEEEGYEAQGNEATHYPEAPHTPVARKNILMFETPDTKVTQASSNCQPLIDLTNGSVHRSGPEFFAMDDGKDDLDDSAAQALCLVSVCSTASESDMVDGSWPDSGSASAPDGWDAFYEDDEVGRRPMLSTPTPAVNAARISIHCACGNWLGPDAAFCSRCGIRRGHTQSGEAEADADAAAGDGTQAPPGADAGGSGTGPGADAGLGGVGAGPGSGGRGRARQSFGAWAWPPFAEVARATAAPASRGGGGPPPGPEEGEGEGQAEEAAAQPPGHHHHQPHHHAPLRLGLPPRGEAVGQALLQRSWTGELSAAESAASSSSSPEGGGGAPSCAGGKGGKGRGKAKGPPRPPAPKSSSEASAEPSPTASSESSSSAPAAVGSGKGVGKDPRPPRPKGGDAEPPPSDSSPASSEGKEGKGGGGKGGKGPPPPGPKAGKGLPPRMPGGKGPPAAPPAKGSPPPKGKGAPPPPGKGGPKAAPVAPAGKASAAKAPPATEGPFGRKVHLVAATYEEPGSATVFGELETGAADFNADLLRAMLAKVNEGTAAAGGPGRRRAITRKPQGIPVLDASRAQNMAIVLSKLKVSSEELCAALHDLDFAHPSLNLEDLELVSTVMPDPEESKKLLQHRENVEALRDVEQKVMPFCTLKRAPARLKLMNFALSHAATHATLLRRCEVLRSAAEQARASTEFRDLLCLVLKTANFINHGVEDITQGARGFDLSSLSTLASFKTGAVSTLHFLCITMQEKDRNFLQEFRRSLADVPEASREKTAQLKASIDSFEKEVESVIRERSHCEEGSPSWARVQALVDSLTVEVESLKACFAQATQQCTETQKYFSISEKAAAKLEAVEQLFGHIAAFIDVLSSAWSEIEKNPAKWRKFATGRSVGEKVARNTLPPGRLSRLSSDLTDMDASQSLAGPHSSRRDRGRTASDSQTAAASRATSRAVSHAASRATSPTASRAVADSPRPSAESGPSMPEPTPGSHSGVCERWAASARWTQEVAEALDWQFERTYTMELEQMDDEFEGCELQQASNIGAPQ